MDLQSLIALSLVLGSGLILALRVVSRFRNPGSSGCPGCGKCGESGKAIPGRAVPEAKPLISLGSRPPR